MYEKIGEAAEGEVTARYGIVAGRVADLADLLDVAPDQLLQAADQAGVEVMVDTAATKGRSRNEEERPTDPALRCLAFAVEDFRAVAAVVGAEEALESGAVPA